LGISFEWQVAGLGLDARGRERPGLHLLSTRVSAP